MGDMHIVKYLIAVYQDKHITLFMFTTKSLLNTSVILIAVAKSCYFYYNLLSINPCHLED